MEPKMSLNECTIKEIKAFIDMNVRETSLKTGKKVKINTFKWTKEMLYNFIKSNDLEDELLDWLNGWYYDLPGYSIF